MVKALRGWHRMSTKRIFTLAHTTLGFLLGGATATSAQETENPQVVVQAEAREIPSAYGAPPDLSHGRISTLTKSYVLSPFSFELESGYEGDIFRHGLPAQLFRQEVEMGHCATTHVANGVMVTSLNFPKSMVELHRRNSPEAQLNEHTRMLPPVTITDRMATHPLGEEAPSRSVSTRTRTRGGTACLSDQTGTVRTVRL
jgi:hypothetical protein